MAEDGPTPPPASPSFQTTSVRQRQERAGARLWGVCVSSFSSSFPAASSWFSAIRGWSWNVTPTNSMGFAVLSHYHSALRTQISSYRKSFFTYQASMTWWQTVLAAAICWAKLIKALQIMWERGSRVKWSQLEKWVAVIEGWKERERENVELSGVV